MEQSVDNWQRAGMDPRWECYKNTPYNNTKKERDYELFERNNLSRNRPKESGSNTPQYC